jgi:hypothetical protein
MNITKNRLWLSSFILLLLIYFILIENPLYSNLIDSFLGSAEFQSFFDRIKFFLPITLLLSITSDFLSHVLGKQVSIMASRFPSRKKLSIFILKGLYFTVLKYWSVITLLSVCLSIIFKNNITDIMNVHFLVVFITGYLLYSMIATIQMLLSLFLDTSKSFLIVVAMAVMSTLVNTSFLKYIFVIPIGMGINKIGLSHGIVQIIFVVIITILSAVIICKKIERSDLICTLN